jgi:hypothetical protein
MKKILHKTHATFFIFVSSLIGLSNSNAQTGTLTASPENVTAFTNSNGTGNTTLTYDIQNNPAVNKRVYIGMDKYRKDGTLVSSNGVVLNNLTQSGTKAVNYISKDFKHVFKLYASSGTGPLIADTYTIGNPIAEITVYGYDPTLGINDEKRDNEGVTVSNDPFTNQFRIHIIDRKASTIELSVFDIGGKMISAPKLIRADTDFMYDASTLQKGLYLLKITLDNKTHLVRKIVKI